MLATGMAQGIELCAKHNMENMKLEGKGRERKKRRGLNIKNKVDDKQ